MPNGTESFQSRFFRLYRDDLHIFVHYRDAVPHSRREYLLDEFVITAVAGHKGNRPSRIQPAHQKKGDHPGQGTKEQRDDDYGQQLSTIELHEPHDSPLWVR